MNRTVLIVDENEMLVRMYRSIFSAMECDVVHARTKRDTLRLLEHEQPELFVVDESLADGSAIDIVREIRAHGMFGKTPVIATFPAHSSRKDEDLAKMNFVTPISKPMQIQEFAMLVRRYVGRRSLVAG